MHMHAFPICLEWHYLCHHLYPLPGPRLPLLFPRAASDRGRASGSPIIHLSFSSLPTTRIMNSRSIATSPQPFHPNSPNVHPTALFGADDASDAVGVVDDDDSEDDDSDLSGGTELQSIYRSNSDDGIEVEIEKIGKNSRRIRSRIAIEANLQTVWKILTDYEKLADFIPGLAVSRLLEKRGNCVRLFQIGQQKLAFGLNFNAKGIVDCCEKPLENLPFGHRRDIEFKMIEGDFQLFEGKWSVEQTEESSCNGEQETVSQHHRKRMQNVMNLLVLLRILQRFA